ncbi:NADH-quinone oxidoreductase subunit N [Acetobacter cibinongensis]|uniref:NADH-quinone oxidoreductase subunit N n=1 Tax=Acetobacter cibinongensis TaxID=146475 RepID=A0A0D6N4B5_9PROT|nr:NADH-quinone oxidoreductase subunit NuoN [Acetobacter cibinongensis]GAN60789.1 NADH-quinone oxidoreductase subunit N [Acetobacter cibinongensis]GBQ12175.1 NADH-quinone oxidoreductase chain N [Acetobacter cibinongensis NRIC 0482]GEL58820.1 NADH-quinone oxidoreductase subunit N [Acetobacter cibinongensis]
MTPNAVNWSLAIPEIGLALSGLLILVIGVLQKRGEGFFSCATLTIAAFIGCGFLVALSPDGVAYAGTFVNDSFARFMKELALVGGLLATVVTVGYQGEARGTHAPLPFETPILMLFSTLGAMIMASSGNLMTLFVGLELSSLSIYILCALERDNVRSSEAGLKYFVLGSLASGLLLYGMSLIYGYAGTMDYAGLLTAIGSEESPPLGLMVGIVFVVVGLCFKLSAVPFHMWTPDVYQGAPTPVTAYMASAPKFAAFALFLRVMTGPFGTMAPRWQILVEVVSLLSMVYGALAAIPQTDIKRLMAYSSIGHMGYAMMGLASASAAGVRATLIYLAAYLVMNAGVFAVIATMQRKGHEVTTIADLAGLGRREPGLAAALAIFMFSMIGVPPLAGFFGKFMVFAAAWQSHLYALVAIGALSSIVGAYYYLRIVKVLYFEESAEAFDPPATTLLFVTGGMSAATVLFILALGPLMTVAQHAAQALVG